VSAHKPTRAFRATKAEKLQMVRLAATIEKLHLAAADPGNDEQAAVEAAGQLGRTMLQHIDLIISGLKNAGR